MSNFVDSSLVPGLNVGLLRTNPLGLVRVGEVAE